MNFSGKEGRPNIRPLTRPGIEPGTSGLGGRDLNHCANPSATNICFPCALSFSSIPLDPVLFHPSIPLHPLLQFHSSICLHPSLLFQWLIPLHPHFQLHHSIPCTSSSIPHFHSPATTPSFPLVNSPTP